MFCETGFGCHTRGHAVGIPILDAKTKQRIDHLKNFGFVDEVTVVAPGINGKMSEFNAALGLLQLKHVDGAIAQRKEIAEIYFSALAGVRGIHVVGTSSDFRYNHAYFPILVQEDYALNRDALYEKLSASNLFARRYFHPLISEFPMYRGLPSAQPANLPIATRTARQVLCLPIFPGLARADQHRVIDLIVGA